MEYFTHLNSPHEVAHGALVAIQALIGETFLVSSHGCSSICSPIDFHPRYTAAQSYGTGDGAGSLLACGFVQLIGLQDSYGPTCNFIAGYRRYRPFYSFPYFARTEKPFFSLSQ